jgi:hypothetical protein
MEIFMSGMIIGSGIVIGAIIIAVCIGSKFLPDYDEDRARRIASEIDWEEKRQ